MHDAQLQRFRRLDLLALQQQRQRVRDADQARQALGATGTWQQAHLHFRQSDDRLRIVGEHAVVAGQA